MRKLPKYIQIKEKIVADIKGGQLPPGAKLAIREELIHQFSVTRATLNKAIQELIAEGWLVAQRNRGTFVAADLQKSRDIAVVVPRLQLDHKVTGNLISAHELTILLPTIIGAKQYPFSLHSATEFMDNLQLIANYDLVIWIMPPGTILHQLEQFRHKVLVINRYAPQLNFITTHHRAAVKAITESYIRYCHERCKLFYLKDEQTNFPLQERYRGFLDACEQYDKFYHPVQLKKNDYQYNLELLKQLPLVADRPNIIISGNRAHTGVFLQMQRECGLKLNHDIFYADFDNFNSEQETGVKITSILQDFSLMGEKIAEVINNYDSRQAQTIQCYIPYRIANQLEGMIILNNAVDFERAATRQQDEAVVTTAS